VERHVDLLGILSSLWGALAMLVGVSMLLLSVGALLQLVQPSGQAVEFAAGLTAGIFALIGAFVLLWGGAHVWAALLLRRRRSFGRVLMLALAVVNLLVLPFGTALGIYAMWVLLTDAGRRLFEPALPVAPAPPR
jgi:asparagine N-glycosylation enzyme membrane subunit Stt3